LERLRHVGAAVERAPDHVVRGAEGHGAEVLDAIDHEASAVVADHRLHEQGARQAHRGLAAPAAEELAVAHDLVEVAPLLRRAADRIDESHDRRVHVDGHRGAGTAAGDRANDRDVRRHVEPETALALGDRAGEEPLAPEVAPALDRIGRGGVVLAGPWRDALARQPLGALDDRALDLLHRSTPRATSVPHIPRGRNRTNAMKMTPITSGQASMTRLRRSARIRKVAAPTNGPKNVPAPPSKVMITTWPEVVQYSESTGTTVSRSASSAPASPVKSAEK